MSEQDPHRGFEERDDHTSFRPASRPGTDSPLPATIGDPAGDNSVDDLTVIRPGPSLRRPASLASDARVDSSSALPPPRQSTVQSLGIEAPNANPIMRAAGPLLLLLGRLRTSLLRSTDSSLVPQIASAIEICDQDLRAAGVEADEANTAKFILCVTADEVLVNLPGGDHDPARRSGLLTRFFGESDGARRFLAELDRAKEDPKAHVFLLELFQACLALCFQGGQKTLPGGAATLQDLRQDLHERLQQARPTRAQALSPRWEGRPLPSHVVRLRIPFWTAAGLVGLFLFVVFVGLRLSLGNRAEAAATALLGLNPVTPVAIGRKEPVPPPPPPPPTPAQATQIEHIRKVLGPNIASGALGVQPSANQIVISITDRVLFQPGKTTILEEVRPLIMYVALALDDEKGPIKVVGHSDTTPMANARFASNFELSLERARSVASLLEKSLSDPTRVEIEGKGADVPIASNDTPDGRSKNRRVEIVIPRRE